ncbi:hypothetical protein L0222_05830 [bacterium]|nr:hypothetical protein [bacterium]
MKKIVSFVLIVLAFSAFSLLADDKDQTFQGTLVDSKCYAGSKGMLKGNDHMGTTGCGTMCAKQGIPVALLDAKNKTHVLLVPSIKLADYVGQEAKVTGKLDSLTSGIIASKVEVQKDGKWEEVKLGADMM